MPGPRFQVLRVERITRGDGRPYLWRLNVVKCPWFAVMLHVFQGPDDDCLHNHPFGFLAVILWGGYFEFVGEGFSRLWDGRYGFLQVKEFWRRPGSVLFRRRGHAHRVSLGRGPAVTLVFCGPRRGSWGFYTPSGFVDWKCYDPKVHCP